MFSIANITRAQAGTYACSGAITTEKDTYTEWSSEVKFKLQVVGNVIYIPPIPSHVLPLFSVFCYNFLLIKGGGKLFLEPLSILS